MKELLDFILRSMLGKDSIYEILEESKSGQSNNESVITLTIKTKDSETGMVIGKSGKVIKAIRNILRIKATLEKKKIVLLVNPQIAN